MDDRVRPIGGSDRPRASEAEAVAPAPPLPPSAPPVGALSYTSLAAYQRCGYRFYVERVLGLPGRPTPPGPPAAAAARRREPRSPPAERGTRGPRAARAARLPAPRRPAAGGDHRRRSAASRAPTSWTRSPRCQALRRHRALPAPGTRHGSAARAAVRVRARRHADHRDARRDRVGARRADADRRLQDRPARRIGPGDRGRARSTAPSG